MQYSFAAGMYVNFGLINGHHPSSQWDKYCLPKKNERYVPIKSCFAKRTGDTR